ncbi:MAG: PKD domain-containing protein [bacterium]
MKETIKKKIIFLHIVLVLLFLFSLLFTTDAHAVTIEADVSADAIWTADMSPYLIMGSISIAADVTLTIEPGTIIKFAQDPNGYNLEVHGTLDARGSDDNPIIFTTEDKEHYWGHIEFTEESTSWDATNLSGCILSHCIIEYGGSGQGDIYGTASIRSISASCMITNSIIRYSAGDGIIAYSGVQNIIDNRIHDTDCGIKLVSSEGGLIENNYLIHNEQGIHITSGANTLQVRNNTVKNTSSEINGGCLGINLLYHNNLSSFLWEQIAGPDVDLSDPNDVKPTFVLSDSSSDESDFTDESLIFQLTVTDNAGLQSADTVTINVNCGNKAPVGDAGPDQSVIEEDEVLLDASDSTDPDNDILFFVWEQTSGSEVTLSDPKSIHCTFCAPTGVGEYGETLIFQVTVTDRGGLQSKDTVIIYISQEDDENEAPVANAGSGQTVDEGNIVTLDGSGSTDTENSIISWVWTQTEGPHVTITNATLLQANFTAPGVDHNGKSLVFSLTVTDDAGQQSSDIVIINVKDTDSETPNSPPTANAGDSIDINEGDNVTVTLNGSLSDDPDETLDTDSYVWEQISGISVTLSGSGTNRTFSAPDVSGDEELIFRLTVTDDHDLQSIDTTTVTVRWVNEAPQADAGPDQTVVGGERVILDGSGSADSDDGIASYVWNQISEQNVSLSNNTVVKPVFIAPDVSSDEQLIFQLTVSDTNSFISHDFVIVTVTAENEAPIADAGPDQVVTGGATVMLNGTGSYDPEDPNSGIVSYIWEQTGGDDVTLYNATTTQPYFTAPQREESDTSSDLQSLTFLLTVKDKSNLESSDSVIVNITDILGSNLVPLAHAGPDQSVDANSTVILDGRNSTDPDIISEILISNNYFISDDSENLSNAIAISKDSGANCALSITANNLENPIVIIRRWIFI